MSDVSTQNREMSGAKHEMAGVMQRIVFAVGPLEAKSAPFPSESENFEGAMGREKGEPKEQRSERNETGDQYNFFFVWLGVQQMVF